MDNEQNSLYKNDFNPTGSMPSNKREAHPGLWWVLFAVLIVLSLVIWGRNSGWFLNGSSETTEELPEGKTLTTSKEGRLVSGFPKDILFEKNADISKSYSITSEGENLFQPVVEYESSLSLSENISRFGTYLEANSWAILNTPDENSAVSSYYARKDNNELNITFDSSSEGVKVVISFVEHK